MIERVVLFAHGAGAPSSSRWMLDWARRLKAVGEVVSFDYPYMKERRRRPDPQAALIAAHREALGDVRAKYPRLPIVLAGKSMGSRIGCHVALEDEVNALVCLGYPLKAMGPRGALRDRVLVELKTPILFVQGTRDALCPLDLLQDVRSKMTAPNELFVVDGGDHSLAVTKTALAAAGETQSDVDGRVLGVVRSFVERHATAAGSAKS